MKKCKFLDKPCIVLPINQFAIYFPFHKSTTSRLKILPFLREVYTGIGVLI